MKVLISCTENPNFFIEFLDELELFIDKKVIRGEVDSSFFGHRVIALKVQLESSPNLLHFFCRHSKYLKNAKKINFSFYSFALSSLKREIKKKR
jgi:hypothetical protein